MNIAFFLTPKKEVVYLHKNATMRQALERMEYHRYSSIPIIDDEGKYWGTLTEGDLLWKLKQSPELSFHDTHTVRIKDLSRHNRNKPVSIDADMDNLIELVETQNFVPVVDDNDVFIGIIKRSDIIRYCYTTLCNHNLLHKKNPVKKKFRFGRFRYEG